jgi:hypothetical protein
MSASADMPESALAYNVTCVRSDVLTVGDGRCMIIAIRTAVVRAA